MNHSQIAALAELVGVISILLTGVVSFVILKVRRSNERIDALRGE